MTTNIVCADDQLSLPGWVPNAARNYLDHIEAGQSFRQLARDAGQHPSTVLRQVRKIEALRDDVLVDKALTRLGAQRRSHAQNLQTNLKNGWQMTKQFNTIDAAPDDETVDREARRILRRLCEPMACLAVAKEMEKAVVVRETDDGRTIRTAVVERAVAEAMALKDWIACKDPGRISRYRITTPGRAALKRLVALDQANRGGFAEAAQPFGDQHRVYDHADFAPSGKSSTRRVRYNLAESPVAAMARRKDKSGQPFLNVDLVNAAERLREDFELSHLGPRITQNWDSFLTAGGQGGAFGDTAGTGSENARRRVSAALADLGPGLGDVVIRVCCFLEGLEAAEKRMGWSARSGKIVLRIALQRLKRHYDELGSGTLIG